MVSHSAPQNVHFHIFLDFFLNGHMWGFYNLLHRNYHVIVEDQISNLTILDGGNFILGFRVPNATLSDPDLFVSETVR